ncbi:N-acetyltransferase [Sebaldella sp. S0638]|uniref:N-acetyltransferase n=1 Tax=Sebaldella sp. S0638 TaxID=2957809 RepID=UPI0020A04DAB|nr:N-acetyltransferase [Sebaldella sp. S0638]MCP1223325.1 N-acetyltransferase [Sebaldella sp. S0638]
MIRLLKSKDVEEVMRIWLDSTLEAHPFISEEYWLENYKMVKDTYIPLSKTYVLEDNSKIKGFISIIDELFIGALFVEVLHQGEGIGRRLIEFSQKRHKELDLTVYKENERAVAFYKKMGFRIRNEQINEDSEKAEFRMYWEMENKQEIIAEPGLVYMNIERKI